jgi:hypothetical protein
LGEFLDYSPDRFVSVVATCLLGETEGAVEDSDGDSRMLERLQLITGAGL